MLGSQYNMWAVKLLVLELALTKPTRTSVNNSQCEKIFWTWTSRGVRLIQHGTQNLQCDWETLSRDITHNKCPGWCWSGADRSGIEFRLLLILCQSSGSSFDENLWLIVVKWPNFIGTVIKVCIIHFYAQTMDLGGGRLCNVIVKESVSPICMLLLTL